MSLSFPLGRVFGTEIRAHWTWVIILALVTVIFGVDLSDQSAAGWTPGLAWATAIATAALVFMSVTAHEIAHVYAARRDGMRMPAIVIQLIGGSFVMDVKPTTAGQEFRVSISGTVASLVLVLLFGTISLFFAFGPIDIQHAPDGVQAIDFACVMMLAFNLFLSVISLVPGYPLDGARVLHSLVWRKSGDAGTAQETANRVGRFVGFSLLGVGILIALVSDPVAGLCVAVAGWLVISSSRLLDRRALLQSLIAGMKASDAQEVDVPKVPPQLTLDIYADEYLADRAGAAAIVERGDDVVGIIGTAQIRRIPRSKWNDTRTEAVMAPIAAVATASPDDDLWSALETLERSGLDALILGHGDEGPLLLTRRAAARLIRVRAAARQVELMSAGRGGGGWFRRGRG